MKALNDLILETSGLIGQPINTQLPVAVEISAIADVLPLAKPGELVYKFSALDTTADTIVDINSNGTITVKKRSPVGYTLLEFKTLESQLEHVYIEDILNSVDTDVFARRNASITRGMDKRELKILIDGIFANDDLYPESGSDSNAITPESGDDIYDLIMDMKESIEDYGDRYVFLVGSSVKSAIDRYKKAKSTTQNYDVDLLGDLAKMGFEIVKVFGKVADDTSTETEDAVMNANKAILIARDSTIAEGKPIKMVRRQISADIASLMGANVDNAQRAIIVNPTPVIDSGSNKRAIGVYGMESFIFALTNPKAIATADFTSLI
jgi:hypothetical protein